MPGRRCFHLLVVVAGDHERRAHDLEALHGLARLRPAALEGGDRDLAEVLLGREAVAEEAVADLAGDLGHQLADAGEEDLAAGRTRRVPSRSGVKNGVISVCV